MSPSDPVLIPLAATVADPDRLFPTLTPAQIERIARHGHRRAIASGDGLVEVGQRPVPFFVVLSGELQVLRPSARNRSADRHASGRAIHRRRQHAERPTGAGADPGQRARRGDRARSRAVARTHPDGRRAERHLHARVRPPTHRADCRRLRRCRPDWLDALRRYAARQGVPDTQWPSVPLHRPRSRRRGAGSARSLPCQRRRRAGADLPRRRSAAESEQSADRRLPGVQRCDRSDSRPRLASSSAQARQGLPLPCTARPKGWTCSSSNRTCPAGKLARARESKTISDFQPAFQVWSLRDAPTHKRKSSARRYWWRKARRSSPVPIRYTRCTWKMAGASMRVH